MKYSFIHQISPFAILLIAYLFTSGVPRIFYLALPASALCLHMFYPESAWLQAALMLIWGLHVLATYRMAGFSIESLNTQKLFVGVLFAVSLILSALLLWWWNPPKADLLAFIGLFLFLTWLIYYLVLRSIAYFVIAPLFCKRKTLITTTLQDYYKSSAGSGRLRVWHSYIRFKDDPINYEIEFQRLRKYIKKIEVPFSYEKCECPFGFTYIRKVKQLTQGAGKASKWDLAPSTQIQRKIKKVIAIGYVVLFVLLIIVALAVLVIWLSRRNL